jgi:hypothetical protein
MFPLGTRKLIGALGMAGGGGVTYETPSYANTGGMGDRTALITITIGDNGLTTQAWSGAVSAWVDGTKTNQIYSTNSGVNAGTAGFWIKFDFGHLVVIDKVKRYGGDVQGQGVWKTSPDNTNWTAVSGTILYDATDPHEETITGTTPFRYLKLEYLELLPNIGGAAYINEYEFSIGNPT